ncbi:hypothetical protein KUCAC02_035696 [Chaenocephalus aceratus]|nr:hypothetical protein KUCAC02_035696 [Chaenocephalus aceratus]
MYLILDKERRKLSFPVPQGGSVCLQSPGAFGDQRGSERRKVEVVLVFGGKQGGRLIYCLPTPAAAAAREESVTWSVLQVNKQQHIKGSH